MSLDKFDDWYWKQEEDFCAEWADGRVEIKMPESTEHNEIEVFLAELIRAFARRKKPGRVFAGTIQIRLENVLSRRVPDLMYISEKRIGIRKATFIEGAPDWVAEIVSPGSVERDHVLKYKEYEIGGVREYWLVNPIERSLTVYVLNEKGKYKKVAEKNGRIESHVFSGLSVRPEWLWNSISLDPNALLNEMGIA